MMHPALRKGPRFYKKNTPMSLRAYGLVHIYVNTVEMSRTARSDKNTNSCPGRVTKTVSARYIFYHTSKKYFTTILRWRFHTFQPPPLRYTVCTPIQNK